MKTPNAPICPRSALEQQLGPIVARLWMLPGASASFAAPSHADAPFDAEAAMRELQMLEARLDATLDPADQAAESFVLLH